MDTNNNEEKKFDYQAAKGKDAELFDAWKKNPSPTTLGPLVAQLKPLIQKEVTRLSGSLPPSALSAEAHKWAIKAINTYDPTKGAQLSTHVTSLLRKTRRMNYKYQNAARLAETQQLKFHEFNTGRQELTTMLNREPSTQELAGHLKWKPKEVEKFKRELYQDFYESGSEVSPEFSRFNSNKFQWEYVLSNLTEDEHKLLKLVTQESEGKKLSAKDIADKLGVDINRYNYLKRKLTDKMHQLQEELGTF